MHLLFLPRPTILLFTFSVLVLATEMHPWIGHISLSVFRQSRYLNDGTYWTSMASMPGFLQYLSFVHSVSDDFCWRGLPKRLSVLLLMEQRHLPNSASAAFYRYWIHRFHLTSGPSKSTLSGFFMPSGSSSYPPIEQVPTTCISPNVLDTSLSPNCRSSISSPPDHHCPLSNSPQVSPIKP